MYRAASRIVNRVWSIHSRRAARKTMLNSMVKLDPCTIALGCRVEASEATGSLPGHKPKTGYGGRGGGGLIFPLHEHLHG